MEQHLLFWQRVNRLIKEKKIKQETLCSEIGINIGTLRNWICRDVYPRVDEALNIANCLGVSIEYLFGAENSFSDDVYRLAMSLDKLPEHKKAPLLQMFQSQVEFWEKN